MEKIQTEADTNLLFRVYLADRPYFSESISFERWREEVTSPKLEKNHYDMRSKDEIMYEIQKIGA